MEPSVKGGSGGLESRACVYNAGVGSQSPYRDHESLSSLGWEMPRRSEISFLNFPFPRFRHPFQGGLLGPPCHPSYPPALIMKRSGVADQDDIVEIAYKFGVQRLSVTHQIENHDVVRIEDNRCERFSY